MQLETSLELLFPSAGLQVCAAASGCLCCKSWLSRDALEILSALSDYFIYIRKYTTNFFYIIPSLSWPLWS